MENILMTDDNKKAIIFMRHGHVNKGQNVLSEAGQEQSKAVAEKINAFLESKEMLLGKNYANRGYYIQLLAPLEDGPALETSRILNDVIQTDQITMAYSLNKGKALSFDLGKHASKAPKETKCLIFSTYQDNFWDISTFCETQGMDKLSDSNAVIFEYEGDWKDLHMYNKDFRGSKSVLTLKP